MMRDWKDLHDELHRLRARLADRERRIRLARRILHTKFYWWESELAELRDALSLRKPLPARGRGRGK